MQPASRAQDPPDEELFSASQKRAAGAGRSAEKRAAMSAHVPGVPFDPSSVSSEALRSTFARSPSGMTVSAVDGRWLWVNDAYCRILGDCTVGDSQQLRRLGVCTATTDVTERRSEERARRERLQSSELICSALAEGRFLLYAQPIVHLGSVTSARAELLIRLRPAIDHGQLVAPASFLPAAEQFGLITLIDEWVVARGIESAQQGHRVTVNVSARTVSAADHVDHIEQAIGDREQFAGDRDQARIDQQQLSHDMQRVEAAISTGRERPILDDRQARIDREQVNRDVNQESLDNAQHGRDVQQEALDETRAMLNLPTSEQPVVADAATIRRGAMERAAAARERAETALVRAQAAVARAQAAELRARDVAASEAD